MNLSDWLQAGWLRRHEVKPDEIGKLVRHAAADLDQSTQPNISNEWRFVMAYNAALSAARAALLAHGYRPPRESQHVRVIESLRHTVGAELQLVRQFNHLRKKRHAITYDAHIDLTDFEMQAMMTIARTLYDMVAEHLRGKFGNTHI